MTAGARHFAEPKPFRLSTVFNLWFSRLICRGGGQSEMARWISVILIVATAGVSWSHGASAGDFERVQFRRPPIFQPAPRGPPQGGRQGRASPVNNAPVLIAKARKAVQGLRPLDCVSSRVEVLRQIKPQYQSDSPAAYLGNPVAFQTLAEAVICTGTAGTLLREAYVNVLTEAARTGDYAAAAEALGPLQLAIYAARADTRDLDNIYGNATGAVPDEYAAAASAMKGILDPQEARYLGNLNSWVFRQTGDPGVEAYYKGLVEYIVRTDDVPTLKRLGQSMIPLFNSDFGGGQAETFDITAQRGAGRGDIAEGRDRIAEARARPGISTIMWLLVAKADPVSAQAMKAKSGKPADPGAPTALTLARLFASSFYRSHEDAAKLAQMGILSMGQRGPYGGWVTWGVPDSIGGGIPTYSETMSFFINDLPGPACKSVGKSYECRAQLYVHTDTVSIQGELANAFIGLLGGNGEIAEQRDARLSDNIQRRNFEWTEVVVTVSRVGGEWRSAQLDAAMPPLVQKLEKQRLATARAMNQAGSSSDPMAATCKSLRAGVAASPGSGLSNNVWYQLAC